MAQNTRVLMDTSMGLVTIEVFGQESPITVANFLGYVDAGFYDGLIFHRVIPGFMVQGGGFESGMMPKKTGAAITNESSNGLSNKRGTLAMARTSDPHSATSQFFINVADNTFLDKAHSSDQVGYCVFGKVVDGMEVVDKIVSVRTGPKSGHSDVPLQEVTIKSVRRVQQ